MRIALRTSALALLVLTTACQSVSLPDPVRGPELDVEYTGTVSSESWITPPADISVQPEGEGFQYSVTVYTVDRDAARSVLGLPSLGPAALQVDRSAARSALDRLEELGLADPLHEAPIELVAGKTSQMYVINQTAYVAGFDLESARDAYLADPRVEVANDGVQVKLETAANGAAVATEMTIARLRKPMPRISVAGPGAPVTFQLPVFVNDRLRVTTPIADGQAAVLGGLPVMDTENVVLAFVFKPEAGPETDADQTAGD